MVLTPSAHMFAHATRSCKPGGCWNPKQVAAMRYHLHEYLPDFSINSFQRGTRLKAARISWLKLLKYYHFNASMPAGFAGSREFPLYFFIFPIFSKLPLN
jgi:hypothetical protein